jgi:hypothetical protein
MALVEMQGMPALTRLLCRRDWPAFRDAAGFLIQKVFNALANMDRSKEIKPDPDVAEGRSDP